MDSLSVSKLMIAWFCTADVYTECCSSGSSFLGFFGLIVVDFDLGLDVRVDCAVDLNDLDFDILVFGDCTGETATKDTGK